MSSEDPFEGYRPRAAAKRKGPSEKDIEAAVCHHAKKRGWYVRKFNSLNHRSVPDRLFISPGGSVIFIEFKRPGGKATDAQVREMERLLEVKQQVYICSDIPGGKRLIDEIEMDEVKS